MNLIEFWQLGYMAIVGLLFFPSLYLLYRQFRKLGAWMNREDGPKERVIPYMLMLAVFGFIAGGLSQHFVDLGVECNKEGRGLHCIIEKL